MAALNDMGGRTEFFGPVPYDPGEPYFHADWERRVFGNTFFAQSLLNPGGPNIDAARWAMEQLPREQYLAPYYWRWLGGLERQLEQKGWLRPGEVEARVEGRPGEPGRRRAPKARTAIIARTLRALIRPTLPRWICAQVLPRLIGGGRPSLRRPLFRVGEPVRVRSEQASGHTRQPGYVTGKSGRIVAHHGAARFADAHAVGRRSRPQHTYTVGFEGRELWGDAAEPGTEVLVELFEPYLEPA
jgi:nitrile hydratase beta subunit